MPTNAFQIEPEHPDDSVGIDHLHETAFGPGRFVRTAFRLREGVAHDPALSFIAKANGTLVGSVRLTPILIGAAPALLLGPLTVSPDFKNKGAGKALLRRSVEEARAKGHSFILLVGDEPYYGPFGFRRVPIGSIVLPGPVDPNRVLLCNLTDDPDASAAGVAGRTSTMARA